MHPSPEVRLWHKVSVATSSWTLEPSLITLASEEIHGKQLSRLLSSGFFSEGKGLSGWHSRLICDRRYHFTLTMGPKQHSRNSLPFGIPGSHMVRETWAWCLQVHTESTHWSRMPNLKDNINTDKAESVICLHMTIMLWNSHPSTGGRMSDHHTFCSHNSLQLQLL
jgi:hypothetical protein